MNWLIRALLGALCILTFPLILMTRPAMRRRLQLDDPGTESYWIVRNPEINRDSYFSEQSAVEGIPAPREGRETGSRVGGGTPWLASVLLIFANLFKPRDAASGIKASSSIADREKGVPDEIYTLW